MDEIRGGVTGRATAAVPRLAITPEELAASAGVGRSRIFKAIRDGELTAYKAGNRTTLVEVEEGKRWLRSLPWRGRPPPEASARKAERRAGANAGCGGITFPATRRGLIS